MSWFVVNVHGAHEAVQLVQQSTGKGSHGDLRGDPSQVDNVFSRAAKHVQRALSGQRQSHQDRSGWWTTNGRRNDMFNCAALQLAV